MNKLFYIICILFLLTGCSSKEVKSSEAVEKVYNTEVIEHPESEASSISTTTEETTQYNLGSIIIDDTKPSETEVTDSNVNESTVGEIEDENTSSSTVDKTDSKYTTTKGSESEGENIELNGRFPVAYNDGEYSYQINDTDSLLKEDAFKDVTFSSVTENTTGEYPVTITSVSDYANDIKEMIILFYRHETDSTSNSLKYKGVGLKEMTPDRYSESMDIFEDGKQRMQVSVFWDKLNNQPIIASMVMVDGSEGETVESN